MSYKDNPLVSVIVPAYNREKTITACLNSIVNQNYVNIEIIIIDDGSTDSTYLKCAEFLQKDRRIVLCHQNNIGIYISRNQCKESAQGEYVIFVDSDDMIDPHMITNMLKFQKKNILIMCGYYYQDNKYQEHKVILEGKEKVENLKLNDFWKLYSFRLVNAPWAKLYEREIICKNKLTFKEGLNLGEDLLFNLSYMRYIKGYCFINQTYFFNVSEDNRLSQKWNENLFEIQVTLYDTLVKFCVDYINIDLISYVELRREYFKVLIFCIDSLYENKKMSYQIKKQKLKELLDRKEFIYCIKNLKECWDYLKIQDKLEIWLLEQKWYCLDYYLRKVWKVKLKLKKV